jgi:uncharacterized protein YjbI with pentapeptide repeats
MITPEISTESLSQQKWWADWRRVDFSWAALARHKIASDDPSSGEETLQDYWRKDPVTLSVLTDSELLAAGEIEKDPAGRLWNIAHMPAAWGGGSPTWKADPNHENWPRFWQLLKKRIFAVQRREFILADEGEAGEKKAQFAGVVFGRTPDDWEWHDAFDSLKISFATCAFLEEADLSFVNSKTALLLPYCLFLRRADFDHMVIEGDVDLSDSTFLRQLSLGSATISGDFRGRGMHCFGEVAVGSSAPGEMSIQGKTKLERSVFYGNSLFEQTTFGGEVSVSYCRFLSVVSFASTVFKHKVTFLKCSFSSEDVAFSGECVEDFYFMDCTLEESFFGYMQFHKAADFSATRFRQSAIFQNTDFHGSVSFRNSIFESDATFKDVRFCGPIKFHNTVFGGVADLSQCSFPIEAGLFHAGFRGAEFRRVADFTNSSFFAWGAFPGTKFHQPVLFSQEVLRSDASFNVALAAAESAAGDATGANSNSFKGRSASDQRFGELEAGFQALKVAMANQQARLEEQRFYRFELVARRRQTTTPFFERIFSILYGFTSAYGTSLVLPAVWLVAVTLVFALIYWTLTITATELLAGLWPFPLRPIDPGFTNALTFSVRNMFQPFSVWTASSGDSSAEQWARAFLNAGGPFHNLVTRLLATLQSLISPILLFLSALAIKRLFQIT